MTLTATREELRRSVAVLTELEGDYARVVDDLASARAQLERAAEVATELNAATVALTTLRVSVTDGERGVVEVRSCADCRSAFPEWAGVAAPSACPSCRLRAGSFEVANAGLPALRHDTPPDTVAAALAYGAVRGLAETEATPLWAEVWPVWSALPGWRAAWYIETVRGIITGVVRSAEDAHLAWREARLLEGWRLGRAFDPFALRHPGLVEWGALPDLERRKHRLFVAVAQSLI